MQMTIKRAMQQTKGGKWKGDRVGRAELVGLIARKLNGTPHTHLTVCGANICIDLKVH